MMMEKFVILLYLISNVYCVSELSEETCETLPSDIHLIKGTYGTKQLDP